MFVMMVPFHLRFGGLVDSLIKMTKPTKGATLHKNFQRCRKCLGSLTACYISFKPGFIASPDRLFIF
jgi:hypothetical protein